MSLAFNPKLLFRLVSFRRLAKTSSNLAFISLVMVSVIGLFQALPASAHEQGFDNNMTAILHFEPDDSPVAHQAVEIKLIDLKNAAYFTTASCDCRLSISSPSGRTDNLLLKTSGKDLHATYTFPDIGTYQLHFTGEPTGPETFSPFDIAYTERVERAAAISRPDAKTLAIYALGVLTLVAISTIGIRFGLKGPS